MLKIGGKNWNFSIALEQFDLHKVKREKIAKKIAKKSFKNFDSSHESQTRLELLFSGLIFSSLPVALFYYRFNIFRLLIALPFYEFKHNDNNNNKSLNKYLGERETEWQPES